MAWLLVKGTRARQNTGMSNLDLLILLFLVIAVVDGVRKGATTQLSTFAGFWLGLGLGAFIAREVAARMQRDVLETFLSVAITFGMASILSGMGRMLGSRMASRVKQMGLAGMDGAAGGALSTISTLLVVWLIGSMLSTVPIAPISRSIGGSTIVKGLVRQMPPAPTVFTKLRGLIGAAGFPQVFAELEPELVGPVALPSDPQVRAAAKGAIASTVKIVGTGCGGTMTGSGFVAAPGLVVTNAHVIAGIDNPVVIDRKGKHISTPVHFDPDQDIAILKTTGLAGRPLTLAGEVSAKGAKGAVLGYPGGGPLKIVPAAVVNSFKALGRDIHGSKLVSRQVYQLQAEVRPGNSGGPFVDEGGRVVGLVFSASAAKKDVGYALRSIEVLGRVEQAKKAGPADTGPCTA